LLADEVLGEVAHSHIMGWAGQLCTDLIIIMLPFCLFLSLHYTKVLILTASLEWFNLLGSRSPEAVGYAVWVRMALLDIDIYYAFIIFIKGQKPIEYRTCQWIVHIKNT
jgi:hypothetical protein